jgi:hypothetical protein
VFRRDEDAVVAVVVVVSGGDGGRALKRNLNRLWLVRVNLVVSVTDEAYEAMRGDDKRALIQTPMTPVNDDCPRSSFDMVLWAVRL